MAIGRQWPQYALLIAAVVLVVFVYVWIIPQRVADGDLSGAVRYVAVGWVPYTIVFYVLGRRFSSPSSMPSMRAADVGIGLFIVSLLLSLGIDRLGFTPERVPEGHVLQALGIYVGLALFGWGLGRRSRALARGSEES